MPAEAALRTTFDDRLHQRAKRQTVAGGDQVDGRAHQRNPYHLPLNEQLGQTLRLETFQPRPQTVIPRVGRLRLQPDQSLDRIEHWHLPAAHQHLSLQRGAVERAQAEYYIHREISIVGA